MGLCFRSDSERGFSLSLSQMLLLWVCFCSHLHCRLGSPRRHQPKPWPHCRFEMHLAHASVWLPERLGMKIHSSVRLIKKKKPTTTTGIYYIVHNTVQFITAYSDQWISILSQEHVYTWGNLKPSTHLLSIHISAGRRNFQQPKGNPHKHEETM